MKTVKSSAAVGLVGVIAGLLILSHGPSEAANDYGASFQGVLVPGAHVLIDASAGGFWLTVVTDERFWNELETAAVQRGTIVEKYPDHIRVRTVLKTNALAPEGTAVLVRIPYNHIMAISTFVELER